MTSIDIGKLIKQQVETLGMSKSEFARRINTTPQNAFGIFKRKSIDTDMLLRISQALDFDFFIHYTGNKTAEPRVKYLRTIKGRDTEMDPAHSDCEDNLAQAEKEIAYLKKINELLELRIEKGDKDDKSDNK